MKANTKLKEKVREEILSDIASTIFSKAIENPEVLGHYIALSNLTGAFPIHDRTMKFWKKQNMELPHCC